MRRWLLPLLTLAIAAVLILLDRVGREDGAAGIDGGPGSPTGSAPEPEGGIQAPPPEATGTDPTRVAVDAPADSVTAPAGPVAEDLGLDLLVLDENGAPVTAVGFHLWRVEDGRPLVEGRQDHSMGSNLGEYRLYGMTTGQWTVVVDGEPSGWPAGVAREQLSVELPYTGPRLEVVLQRPGTLAGRVEDYAGLPLSGVRVRGWLSEPRTRIGKPTDEQGEFHLGAVRVGRWKLIAELRGAKTEQMVEVLPGSDSYQVLRFERAGAIEGVVLYEGGEPLAGWRVSLIGGSPNVDRVQTDEDGRFRFSPVAPGTYTLLAVPGFQGVPGIRPTPPERRATTTAVVVAEETVQVTLVKALAVDAVVVHGTLTLAGEPVPDVGISALREGEVSIGMPHACRTDELGRFSIPLPGPGPVLFRADTAWAQVTLSFVQVPPVPRFRLDLALPASTVAGTLLDEEGQPRRWRVSL
ncbi:MAG: carboxypeptidase-like regulatory domain-containing protein, partial [Planctomycetota bacterium]